VRANPFEHGGGGQAQDLGVGEAELRALGAALAVDEGKVLRVVLEILRRGHELIEGVDEGVNTEILPPVDSSRCALLPLCGCARPSPCRKPRDEGLAVLEGGPAGFIEWADAEGGLLGDAAELAREPAAAELVEQRIDAVDVPRSGLPATTRWRPAILSRSPRGRVSPGARGCRGIGGGGGAEQDQWTSGRRW